MIPAFLVAFLLYKVIREPDFIKKTKRSGRERTKASMDRDF